MNNTIESLLHNEKPVTAILTVKLIKEIGGGMYIIVDKSKLAIMDITSDLSQGKVLIPGCWYKLIKCKKGDQETVKTNGNFKPIKAHIKHDIKEDPEKIENLEKKMSKSKPKLRIMKLWTTYQ